jgi:hypothetical protein
MAYRKHDALAKPGTVAYLVANAERLTKNGAFTGQQAARTVFLHLCCHPAAVWTPDKPSTWGVRVDNDSCDPGDIAEATGLTRRSVDRALDWLAAGGFIDLTRKGTGPRKRYGAVIISATNPSTDWKRRYGHDVLKHPLSPGYGRDVLNKDMVSLSDGPQAVEEPPKPKRTVSGVRSSCGNTGGSEPPATLKAPPQGARMGAGEDAPDARTSGRRPGEYPVPATRPQTGVAGLDKAGHSVTVANDSTSTPSAPSAFSASSTPSASSSGSRQRPGSPRATRPGTVLREAQACEEAGPVPIGDPLDIGCASPSRHDGQESPGFPSGEARMADRIDLDVARFRLYYDTGQRAHRDSHQDNRMAMA